MDEDSSAEISQMFPEEPGNTATMNSPTGVGDEATSIGSSYTQPGNTIGLTDKETLNESLRRGTDSLTVYGGGTAIYKWKMTVSGLKNPWGKVTVEFEQEQSVFSCYDEEIQRPKTIKTVDSAMFGELFGGWPRDYPEWVQNELQSCGAGHKERSCLALAAKPRAELIKRRLKELSYSRAGEMLDRCDWPTSVSPWDFHVDAAEQLL